jgi:hypothetical protein
LVLLLAVGCTSSTEDFEPFTVVTAPNATEDRAPAEGQPQIEASTEPTPPPTTDATLLVMLGTGTPNPVPDPA